jgi:hypothetical protein
MDNTFRGPLAPGYYDDYYDGYYDIVNLRLNKR